MACKALTYCYIKNSRSATVNVECLFDNNDLRYNRSFYDVNHTVVWGSGILKKNETGKMKESPFYVDESTTFEMLIDDKKL